MDLASFKTLLTPSGQAALQAAEDLEPREGDFLRHFQVLEREFPADLARAALETAILRAEAHIKFPFARRMYFTRPALEQASAYEVSSYRSERFRICTGLADLACSIGGDTLTMAALAPVTGIDIDPLRLVMAQANLRALKLGDRAGFVRCDLRGPLPLSLPKGAGLFFDPARRAGGRRIHSVRDYLPPLEAALSWLRRYPAMGVKISPGVKLEELEGYDAEVEFISLNGDLKEATLWFGPLKQGARRATVLPGPHSLSSSVNPEALPRLPLEDPQAYLYEPDASVLRAGLVSMLGTQLDAVQLDPDIAYLSARERRDTPFARAWAVEDWFPFGLKKLRTYLRVRGVGRVTVKKRGSPLEPEALIRALRLSGESERVVFLTHLRGRPIVVVCFPQESHSAPGD